MLYIDQENGHRIISKWLNVLKVDPYIVDDFLSYHFAPEMGMNQVDRQAYVRELEAFRPGLIVFDSWLNFIGKAGLNENENTDIAKWSVAYLHPARQRGITTLLLDHVGHGDDRPRGASRKGQEMDVQWRVKRNKPMGREQAGEFALLNEKDRENWLPRRVGYRMGGTPFVFERTDVNTPNAPSLSPNANKLKAFLKERGGQGAKWHEMEALIGSKGSTSNAVFELQEHGYVSHEERKPYYYVEPKEGVDKPDAVRFKRFNKGSDEQLEQEQHEEGSRGSHPYKGEPLNLDAEPYIPTEEEWEEVIEMWRERWRAEEDMNTN